MAPVAAIDPPVTGADRRTTTMEYTLKGAQIAGMPRRSRTYGRGRVCSHDDCPTRLSQYNKRDTCSVHTGVIFPRLRGHTKHLKE